jgi:hypothetical protein
VHVNLDRHRNRPRGPRSVLDPSILFAMIVYVIAGLFLNALIDWLTSRLVVMREHRAAAAQEETRPPAMV